MKLAKIIVEKILGNKENTYQQKERSLFIGFIFAFASLVPTISAMLLANSTILQSNALRSGSETLVIFFSWLTVRKATQQTSPEYNYGYGKLENLTSLFVATVMIISLVVIFRNAVVRFQNPVPIEGLGTGIGLVFAIIAGNANGWYWFRTHGIARKSPSPIMESQWRLFRARTMANLCVVFSLGISGVLKKFSWTLYIDPIGSVILSGFLLFSAYSVISMSMYDLVDKTLEESLQLIILRELTAHFDEYLTLHGVRSRRSGSNIYIEIFLEFEAERKMREVQHVVNIMKEGLERKIQGSQVTISLATCSPHTK